MQNGKSEMENSLVYIWIKWNALPKNMNRIRVFSVVRFFFYIHFILLRSLLLSSFSFENDLKSKKQQQCNAHLAWCMIRKMCPFHSLIQYHATILSHLLRYACQQNFLCLRAYRREMKYMHKYAIGKAKRSTNEQTNE